MRTCAIVGALSLINVIWWVDATRADDISGPPPLVADDVIQQQIEGLIRRGAVVPSPTLPQIARGHAEERERVVRQVLYFVTFRSIDGDTDYAIRLLQRSGIFERIPSSAIAFAVAPYLESDDVKLRDAAELLLMRTGAFAIADTYGEPYMFAELNRYLASLPKAWIGSPPSFLVHAMYRRHPRAALNTLRSVLASPDEAGTREELALDVISIETSIEKTRATGSPPGPEVWAALRRLAKSDRWWIRLYVGAVMQKRAELRSEHTLAQLASDRDAVVRTFFSESAAERGETSRPATAR